MAGADGGEGVVRRSIHEESSARLHIEIELSKGSLRHCKPVAHGHWNEAITLLAPGFEVEEAVKKLRAIRIGESLAMQK